MLTLRRVCVSRAQLRKWASEAHLAGRALEIDGEMKSSLKLLELVPPFISKAAAQHDPVAYREWVAFDEELTKSKQRKEQESMAKKEAKMAVAISRSGAAAHAATSIATAGSVTTSSVTTSSVAASSITASVPTSVPTSGSGSAPAASITAASSVAGGSVADGGVAGSSIAGSSIAGSSFAFCFPAITPESAALLNIDDLFSDDALTELFH